MAVSGRCLSLTLNPGDVQANCYALQTSGPCRSGASRDLPRPHGYTSNNNVANVGTVRIWFRIVLGVDPSERSWEYDPYGCEARCPIGPSHAAATRSSRQAVLTAARTRRFGASASNAGIAQQTCASLGHSFRGPPSMLIMHETALSKSQPSVALARTSHLSTVAFQLANGIMQQSDPSTRWSRGA